MLLKKKGNILDNLEGSIERWFAPRGYGFIEIPGKGDVFVHVNDIVGLSSTDALNFSIWGHSLKGSKVRFSVVETVRGYKAKNVEITEQKVHPEPALQERDSNFSLPTLEKPSQSASHGYGAQDENMSGVPVQSVHLMRSNSYNTIGQHPYGPVSKNPHPEANVIRFPPNWMPSNRMPQAPLNEVKRPMPPKSCQCSRPTAAYSDMVRQSVGTIFRECVAPDIHFYNCLVDYIVEFAGTISLSLINFNNNMDKPSQFYNNIPAPGGFDAMTRARSWDITAAGIDYARCS